MTKPIVLCILDGWGIAPDSAYNAITQADPKWFNFLSSSFPSAKLLASGLNVGLPDEQMGNSEVGHMTIGSGRKIEQELVRINNELASVLNGKEIEDLISNLYKTKKACHLIGLASNGGVHSHIDHLMTITERLIKAGVKVHLHLITDGRDTPPNSREIFINPFRELEKQNPLLSISTIMGRFFAMDRDKRFDRTLIAFKAIVEGLESEITADLDNSDEFIKPQINPDYHGMEDGDAVIFSNFRADRMRQLCNAILNPESHTRIKFSSAMTLTSYSKSLDALAFVLFPQKSYKNTLSEILHQHKIASLRIAETEKYAHVTFFFDAGKEIKLPDDEQILIPSPSVATYDKQPEMSANKVTDSLLATLSNGKHGFAVVNYANTDMVGHTGNFNATIEAVKAVDVYLGKLYETIVEKMEGTLIIVADHGNAEKMLESNEKHTAHTTNPVPFIIATKTLKNNSKAKLKDGTLADVAPTILNLFGINQPEEMTGQNLLTYTENYAYSDLNI